jgi:translation elongation factor P/translation initiation factor 5A
MPMILDMTAIGVLLSLALNSINLLTQFRTILSSGEKKLDERLVAAEAKLVEHDRRVQAIEGEMKHLPDHETFHRLELAVEKMSGRLDTMAETLKPIRATSERMNELLVEQAKK